MHYYKCPGCKDSNKGKNTNNKYCHWDVHSPQKTRSGGMRMQHETHHLTPPDPIFNPVLYHHMKTIMENNTDPTNHFTLSLTRTRATTDGERNAAAKLHTFSLPLSTNNLDATVTIDEKEKLITLFQLLHPVLVLSSKKAFDHRYNSLSSHIGSGSMLFDAAGADDTCLFQCMYSLSTGKYPPSLSEIETMESTQRKNLLVQIFCIAELVRSQCVWKGRSILKNFVGQQLMVNCAPQALYRILNQLGVSNSNETVRIDAIKDSKKKILAGYPLDGKKYDLFLILFDNLGFRVRGGKNLKVGFEQYTALELVNIPKEKLVDWGVYPNKEKNLPGKYKIKSSYFFMFYYSESPTNILANNIFRCITET